jgi:hypothetical protein
MSEEFQNGHEHMNDLAPGSKPVKNSNIKGRVAISN